MQEAQAIYTVVVGIGALLGIVAPIIKLSNAITKLTASIDYISDRSERQDARLDAHSKELGDHEKRISHLEG